MEHRVFCYTPLNSFVFSLIRPFVRSVFCLPKRALQRVRSGTSFFNFHYPLFSLGHPVTAYVFFSVFLSLLSCIFPSLTCFRRQFIRKMWPIQLAFLLCIVLAHSSPPRLFVILHFSHYRCNSSSPSFSSTTFQTFQVSKINTHIFKIYVCQVHMFQCSQCPYYQIKNFTTHKEKKQHF